MDILIMSINEYAVVVAAVAAFALGGIWYGPLFGSRWQTLVNLSDEQIAKSNMLLIFGSTFVLNLFLAAMLSLIMGHAVQWEAEAMNGASNGAVADFVLLADMPWRDGALNGAGIGLLMGLAFVVPTFGVNYLFARHPLPLYGIDVGYMLLQLVLMGAILGAW